jgi:hypothetical protein
MLAFSAVNLWHAIDLTMTGRIGAAGELMQQWDPNGTWSPAACRAEGIELPTASEMLQVLARWAIEDLPTIC